MHGALDCGRRGSSPWRVGHTLGYFLHREQLASSAASSSHHLGQSDALEVIDCTLRSLRNDSRPFGGVTVVVSGDFCQLPVVKKSHLLWRYATELKLTINTRLLQGRLSQQNIVANYTKIEKERLGFLRRQLKAEDKEVVSGSDDDSSDAMPDLADSSDDDMPGLSPLSASSSDEENFVVSGDIMIDELLTSAAM